MSAECVVCGREMADTALVCPADALSLSQALQTAAGHAEDAEAVLSRQTRYRAGSRGGSELGLTPDPKTAERYGRIALAIGGWARIVTEDTGRQPKWRPTAGPLCMATGVRCEHGSCEAVRRPRGTSTLALEAAWLSRPRQVDFLRKHPAAQEAFKDLHDACRDLARLVDRPADRELVGVCDCGKVLYTVEGRAFITCPMPTCKLIWNVDESRDILRRHLGDKLVTAPEAARLAAYLDPDRTQDGIRKLIASRVKAGLLVAHSEIEVEGEREPMYQFGEVAQLLATIPKRNRERTAA